MNCRICEGEMTSQRWPHPLPLPEGIQTLRQRALPAGKHRRIAQREAARFGLAKLLHEIKKIGRLVGLERYHKFLIVETERVSRVKFYRAIFRTHPAVLVHHFLSLFLRAGIPLASPL